MKPKKIKKAIASVVGDRYATPWDEHTQDWGPRNDNPLRPILAILRHDRSHDTW